MKLIKFTMSILLFIVGYFILRAVIEFDDTSVNTVLVSTVRLILRICFFSMILNFIYHNNENSIKMFKLNRVKQFKTQSTKSLNIFNKTIADLIKVNKEISKRIKVNYDKSMRLKDENAHLSQVKEENEQVITKIKNITL